MPTYDIPVICSVQADSIDAAREIAYEAVEAINEPFCDDGERINAAFGNGKVEFMMANDEQTTRDHRRVFLLHPSDTTSDYDQEAYNEKLKDQDHEQE